MTDTEIQVCGEPAAMLKLGAVDRKIMGNAVKWFGRVRRGDGESRELKEALDGLDV